jgi:hypothetical protein
MKNWEPLLGGVRMTGRQKKAKTNLRVGTSVGHGQQTGLGVLELEVLIGELLAVDGATTGALLEKRDVSIEDDR